MSKLKITVTEVCREKTYPVEYPYTIRDNFCGSYCLVTVFPYEFPVKEYCLIRLTDGRCTLVAPDLFRQRIDNERYIISESKITIKEYLKDNRIDISYATSHGTS